MRFTSRGFVPNRVNEIHSMPIQASKHPSKNGFVFSDEEIARAVVRERYIAKAKHEMSDMPPFELYGSSLWTHPDTLLMNRGGVRQVSRARAKKDSRHLARIHRAAPLQHPEEFYGNANTAQASLPFGQVA
jgi:hypothetical protein